MPEHRSIAACLEAIAAAMLTCAGKARAEAAELLDDRPWRDVTVGIGRGTLYKLYDLPRIERLRAAESDAEALAGQARVLRETAPLAGVPAQDGIGRTAVFANVPAYAAAYRQMSDWRAEGGFAVDEGTEARRKETARMYEQWVFLQIAAAIIQAGLVAEDMEDVLRRIGSHRLVADLHRGATLRFRHAPSGRIVSIAYEPWIRPRAAALAAGDAFYKGRAGEAAWSPDVLLAVHADSRTSRPEAAFVLDAKYSRRLSEQQWDETSKYLFIRRTADDKPAVRQVWLICPGVEGIGLRDSAVAWTEQGPDRPSSEFLQGYARMAPDPSKPVGAPVPEAVVLVMGLLRHIGLTLSPTELDV